MENEERLTLSVEEAAKSMGISRGLAYSLAKMRRLPVIRLGKRLLIPKKALQDMLAGNWKPEGTP